MLSRGDLHKESEGDEKLSRKYKSKGGIKAAVN